MYVGPYITIAMAWHEGPYQAIIIRMNEGL
jgi:hypothetical protein